MITKTIDSKGRLLLGQEYAGRLVIVDEQQDRLVITPAVVIPEREAWLYRNPAALAEVRTGLQQAQAGQLVDWKDVAADPKFVAELDDS